MLKNKKAKFIFISSIAVLCCLGIAYNISSTSFSFTNNIRYDANDDSSILDQNQIADNAIQSDLETEILEEQTEIPKIPVTHIKTPDIVKSLYISAWVAGSENFRNSLIKIIDNTELNAVVIDIKDSTGRVSFPIDDPQVKEIGSPENRIRNIRAVTSLLHSKNIYVIGRISVFQDPYLTKLKPEWAIKRLSNGGVWKDKKGLSFLDPTNKEVHDYILNIAKGAYENGFDEINFDYIRYPSDGNMKDINYNLVDGKTRADNIEAFFKYLSSEMKKDVDIPISADLFGLTTEAMDDMGIGQIWEKTIPYFDFVCPMVYPSHYPSGYNNFKNPAAYPYEVINRALMSAVVKTNNATENILKIRPWLQDFDLGATYTKELIRDEIKAVYDNGLNSWMLWDPSNKYTPSALKLETISQ